MNNKLYLVETVSFFRMRYVVEAREATDAEGEVTMRLGTEDLKEFSQHHVNECITSTREISATDFMNMFDKDNDYLAEWPVAKKMNFINTVVYKDEE
jgi:hypothetical protein